MGIWARGETLGFTGHISGREDIPLKTRLVQILDCDCYP